MFEFIYIALYCLILLFLWTFPPFSRFLSDLLTLCWISLLLLLKTGCNYFSPWKQIPLAIRLYFLLSRSEREANVSSKSRPGVCKLQPTGQIWHAVYFCK